MTSAESSIELARKVEMFMLNELQKDSELSCTNLAEAAAVRFEHQEWINDPLHWVWDLALIANEKAFVGRDSV